MVSDVKSVACTATNSRAHVPSIVCFCITSVTTRRCKLYYNLLPTISVISSVQSVAVCISSITTRRCMMHYNMLQERVVANVKVCSKPKFVISKGCYPSPRMCRCEYEIVAAAKAAKAKIEV